MTNLIAKISFALVTNWVPVSVTSPVVPPSERNFSIYRRSMITYVGTVASNTVATVEWRGRSIPMILESVEVAKLIKTEPQLPQLELSH